MLALLFSMSALCFYVAIAIIHHGALRYAMTLVPVKRARLVFFWCVVFWPLPWLLKFVGIGLQVEDADGNLCFRIFRAQ